MKKPFVTKDQLEAIAARYPTPFHIYDEKGIRANARRLKAAFAWNPGYREYFAVKATPTPAILQILKEEGCGCDCSSTTELLMSERVGVTGESVMFSSNETPAEEFRQAADLGAIINLDDITLIPELEEALGGRVPEKICCRYNPGGTFTLGESAEGFQVMDNPGDAKYGMTREQLIEAFKYMKQKGVKHFGIHAFLASNTVANEYYPALARILFKLAVEVQKETGVHIAFINLSGGVGIPYRPEQTANDILDQWLAGDATEESFANMANENSSDPGSNTNGGLYENVYPGQMVETFNDWCFADGRQPGDYGIVKTDYGYHIIFFVGAGDEIYWFQTAKEDYLSDLAVKIQDEITAKYTFVSYVDQAALVDVLTAANDSEAAQ